jgi:hypothetical protein
MGLRAPNANGNHQKRDRRVSSSVNPANILNSQVAHGDLKRKAAENKETTAAKIQNLKSISEDLETAALGQ